MLAKIFCYSAFNETLVCITSDQEVQYYNLFKALQKIHFFNFYLHDFKFLSVKVIILLLQLGTHNRKTIRIFYY